MKSIWRVSSQVIAGKKKYIVYRLKDAMGVDHSGNREYAPEMEYTEDRQLARGIAYELNALEGL